MIDFDKLFGSEPNQIKEICIIAPFLHKDLLAQLGIDRLSKGTPFSTAHTDNFSFIHTQIGATFVGDAVLYLNETPCKYLILYGSCGLIDKDDHINVGSVVIPESAYNLESFSSLLQKDFESVEQFYAHEEMTKLSNSSNTNNEVSYVTCATFGSILLEQKYKDDLIKKNVRVVDMECSAFYAAAKHTDKQSLAVFYATDIIGENLPFGSFPYEHQALIKAGQEQTINYILRLVDSLQKSKV